MRNAVDTKDVKLCKRAKFQNVTLFSTASLVLQITVTMLVVITQPHL